MSYGFRRSSRSFAPFGFDRQATITGLATHDFTLGVKRSGLRYSYYK